MDADLAAGRLPFLVSANGGTTNTGAVDDLEALRRICDERGAWLHVDAAYGGFAVLSDRGRAVLGPLALADSVTLDPHKWLAMPFEVGCLLVREAGALERAFELHPEYLQDRPDGPQAVNFADRGLQLTRASRAIKVWLAIQTFGVDAFREAIDRAIDLTLVAQGLVESDPRLELVSPASLGVVAFRRRGAPDSSDEAVDRLNEAVVAGLAAAGDLLLTSTRIRGRYAIRLCVLNHTSAEEDVAFALDRVASETTTGEGTAPVGSDAREPGGGAVRSGVSTTEVAMLRGIPPFGTVTDDQARRFLGAASEERYRAGEHVIDRWAYARTFYIAAEGRLSVRVEDREVNVLLPGDHFGEIAAIDWGRDFSYGRTATVVAVEPSRLLAMPAAALRELMAEAPEIDHEIRRIANARLEAG